MQMQTTYGIFDNEADHVIAMVHAHSSLDLIVATPCPACGATLAVVFSEDGTCFALSCRGDTLHITKQQHIDNPPPWWQQCYEKPKDTTWYWRDGYWYDVDGTLHMKIYGWQADDVRWSGALECPRDHRDYDFWNWILNESGCKKELISDTDLDELRAQYQSVK